MSDWDYFMKLDPFYLRSDQKVEINDHTVNKIYSKNFTSTFPILSKLLKLAGVTSLLIDDSKYELYSWNSKNGEKIGWLCQPPISNEIDGVYEDHNNLLSCFGGIVERFNELEKTWLLNLVESLTKSEASHDGSFIEDYKWAFEDEGMEIPIILESYYSIAREANGNTTICHRKNGDLILFAPDHSFDYLTIYPNCPEYSLYTINGAPVFKDWVETIANQWLKQVQIV